MFDIFICDFQFVSLDNYTNCTVIRAIISFVSRPPDDNNNVCGKMLLLVELSNNTHKMIMAKNFWSEFSRNRFFFLKICIPNTDNGPMPFWTNELVLLCKIIVEFIRKTRMWRKREREKVMYNKKNVYTWKYKKWTPSDTVIVISIPYIQCITLYFISACVQNSEQVVWDEEKPMASKFNENGTFAVRW